MKYIGAHVSISGGVETAPGRAKEIGANALGIFTKNQRQWKAKPLTEENIKDFKANLSDAGIAPGHVIVHDSYLINIGNPDEEKRRKSLDALIDEVRRVEQLDLVYLNFHPGSGLGKLDEDETISLIAGGVKEVLSESESAVLLIEATAGQGAHVGYRFEHLADIMEQAKGDDRVAVCLDTCHIFAAGYDLRSAESYAATMEQFDSIVGMENLKAIHVNDARADLGSRLDRHDSLGEGTLGWKTFEHIVKDKRTDGVPLILETPVPDKWEAEISRMFEMAT